MADFLFEIGLEEVPARMLASAEAELARRTVDLLRRERLLGESYTSESYSTPRRLAVLVRRVLTHQPDAEEELLGPPVKAAYKDGKPTAAADAFAKKAGVAVEALRTVTNAKGEYLAATANRPGRSFSEVIAPNCRRKSLRSTGPRTCTGARVSRSGLYVPSSGCSRCWTRRRAARVGRPQCEQRDLRASRACTATLLSRSPGPTPTRTVCTRRR